MTKKNDSNLNSIAGTHFWRGPVLGRRLFFRHIASAVGGYFVLPSRPMETVAKAGVNTVGTAKNVIFILMQGGPAHVDTFDLKVGSWTPSFLNPTNYGDIAFPQGIMPKLADQMDSIALVRSMYSWAAVHGLAQTWTQIGRNPTSGLARIAPHVGSVVALELSASSQNRTIPPFVALNTNGGPGAGYLPPQFAPFYINPGGAALANTTHAGGQAVLDRRYSLLQDLDAETRQGALGPNLVEMAEYNLGARKLMYNPEVDKVFVFDQTTKNAYGNSGFGNACVVARNLIRADMGTRFIQITHGSWDHHSNIYGANGPLQTMAKQFDSGLGQLIADLKQDGTFDQTLIVAFGEFGRTVGNVNQQGGRDHYRQQAGLFAGAKITGRRVLGKTDQTGSAITEYGWSRNREIKFEDVLATMYSALGIDWTTVRHDDPLGRGFEYVPFAATEDRYGPINELWS